MVLDATRKRNQGIKREKKERKNREKQGVFVLRISRDPLPPLPQPTAPPVCLSRYRIADERPRYRASHTVRTPDIATTHTHTNTTPPSNPKPKRSQYREHRIIVPVSHVRHSIPLSFHSLALSPRHRPASASLAVLGGRVWIYYPPTFPRTTTPDPPYCPRPSFTHTLWREAVTIIPGILPPTINQLGVRIE